MTWTTRPRSNFSDMAFFRSGSRGPRILCLHGVGLKAESWNAVLDKLPYNFDVRAIDLPGHGGSADMDSHIQDVTALTDKIRDHIYFKPDFIIGHSLGALLALDWAIRYPQGLKGIAVLNAIYQRSQLASQAVIARAEQLKQAGVIDPTVTLNRWFGDVDEGLFPKARLACHNWLTSNRIGQYAKAYGIFARSFGPDPEMLKHIKMPILFVTGSDEPNSTPAMSKAMAMTVPNGKVKIVKGAAHMALMTHATDISLSVGAFFEKHKNKKEGNV